MARHRPGIAARPIHLWKVVAHLPKALVALGGEHLLGGCSLLWVVPPHARQAVVASICHQVGQRQ